MDKNTIVIYGAKRSGNHYLQSYFKDQGHECEFRHEADYAKKLYDKKGKHLIVLVRNPRDQIISNSYSMFNADKDGYGVGTKNQPLTDLSPQEIPYQIVGSACQYIKDFTDTMVPLVATHPYQFILYDTIAQKNLNSIYTKRDPEYYKKAILNYDGILDVLNRSDIEEYCLKIWRAFNLQQTVFYPELANV